jgi:cation transport ATPase
LDGFRSLRNGNPNMNSLVGVGSTASFVVGAASALVPGLGLDAGFMEEPVMLLAFVLLGALFCGRFSGGFIGLPGVPAVVLGLRLPPFLGFGG